MCQSPISAAYAGEDEHSAPKVKQKNDDSESEESDKVKKEKNKTRECLILSFVDHTGNAKKNLELNSKAFESWGK
jgi:hypothetical protein